MQFEYMKDRVHRLSYLILGTILYPCFESILINQIFGETPSWLATFLSIFLGIESDKLQELQIVNWALNSLTVSSWTTISLWALVTLKSQTSKTETRSSMISMSMNSRKSRAITIQWTTRLTLMSAQMPITTTTSTILSMSTVTTNIHT